MIIFEEVVKIVFLNSFKIVTKLNTKSKCDENFSSKFGKLFIENENIMTKYFIFHIFRKFCKDEMLHPSMELTNYIIRKNPSIHDISWNDFAMDVKLTLTCIIKNHG